MDCLQTIGREREMEDDPSWIGMACFLEGIDPAALGLPLSVTQRVEAILQGLENEAETSAYWRCLEALSGEVERELDHG
jgi:hypothetical protein